MPDTPKPVSEKQLGANRANASRSTGPRTPEGKARSAQNARKHGFYAANYNVPLIENPEEIAELREDLVAFYHPRNSQELLAVEMIAIAQLSRLRAAHLECGLFTSMLDQVISPERDDLQGICPEVADPTAAPGKSPDNRGFFLAEGFRRMNHKVWSGFLRHQAQTERFYRRAIEEFNRLQALPNHPSEELPNEPVSAPQPEETAPFPTPPNEPEKEPENEPENEPSTEPDGPPAPAGPPPATTAPPPTLRAGLVEGQRPSPSPHRNQSTPRCLTPFPLPCGAPAIRPLQ